jgi:hypothetical protein
MLCLEDVVCEALVAHHLAPVAVDIVEVAVLASATQAGRLVRVRPIPHLRSRQILNSSLFIWFHQQICLKAGRSEVRNLFKETVSADIGFYFRDYSIKLNQYTFCRTAHDLNYFPGFPGILKNLFDNSF